MTRWWITKLINFNSISNICTILFVTFGSNQKYILNYSSKSQKRRESQCFILDLGCILPILDSMWLSKNEVKVGVAFITIGKVLNSNDRWKAKCSLCQEYITALHSIQLCKVYSIILCTGGWIIQYKVQHHTPYLILKW